MVGGSPHRRALNLGGVNPRVGVTPEGVGLNLREAKPKRELTLREGVTPEGCGLNLGVLNPRRG